MAFNIIDMASGYLTNEVISKASSFLGENESSTAKAVSTAIPTLVAGLMNKASDSNGASMIFNLLNSGNNNGSMLNNLSSMFGGGDETNNLVSKGAGLMDTLFGSKSSGVADLLSSTSGISSKSSSSLLAMLAPVVMNLFGKEVASNGLDLRGFTSLLGSQKSFISGLIPSGLTSMLGLGSIADLGGKLFSGASNAASTVTSAASSAYQNTQEKSSGLAKFLPWLLAAFIAMIALYFWKGCGKAEEHGTEATTEAAAHVEEAATSVAVAADSAASNVADEANGLWANLGKFFTRKLSTGIELNIPETGIENQLITFIEDANKPVDKTTWFNFDRLLFETGSASLKPESQEQLKNMVEILKAFPAVELKIGGYTDNTGKADANLKLSAARANNVMAELVKLGVDAARLKAEGYGDQFPVATNDTEEGRAQNRRISCRVTKK
ncbi:MAG: DUF937 domain-containing protein [Bacteroidetes bacterium]|nr:DUF937 domain-containing protein [Bacteroidota bacterium]